MTDFRMTRTAMAIGVAGIAMSGEASPAFAQAAGNPTYQAFFGSTVCNNPTGTFLQRCSETFDPTKPDGDPNQFANISASSESSLTPNQTSAAASSSLARAQALSVETEKRLEALRDEDAGKPGKGSDKIAGFGPWSLFANAEGEWFDQTRPAFANERGFKGDRYRGTFGADYRASSGTHLGLMLSYENYSTTFDREIATTNFSPQANSGEIKAKTFAATAFASLALAENVWLDASAGFGWSKNKFRRNAVFQPGTLSLSRNINTLGSASGRQAFIAVSAGYDHANGPLSFGPYIRGRYSHSEVDAYTETESVLSGLAMNVSKQKATSFTGIVGVRSSYAISASWGVVVPQVRLEYEHEFKDDPRTTTTSFVLDPNRLPFTVRNDPPDRNHANIGVGLAFVLPRGVTPFVDYEALVGYAKSTRHRVAIGLRIEL